MPKPPSSTRTVRLADEAWEWLKLEGEKRGETVNAMVGIAVAALRAPMRIGQAQALRSASVGQSMKASHVATYDDQPPRKAPAVHVAVPVFERKAFNPQKKPTKWKK